MDEGKKVEGALGPKLTKAEAVQRIVDAVIAENRGKRPKHAFLKEGAAESATFKDTTVRRVFHNNEWYFSIVDVIEAVVETDRPSKYWSDLKRQLAEKEGFFELSEKIGQLKMPASDGKEYMTDAVNVETLFRIVQSIPSKKAEPFKRWLAKVGYERIEEIQNPEIAVKRAILQWQLEGREDDWIDARIRSIVTRKELVGEWRKRGVQEGVEYAVLTNIISRETFALDTQEHKKVKDLGKSHNLRDHMTDLELIFTMLGEKSTTAIAVAGDAKGFDGNSNAAHAGGKVAGDARRELERQTGTKVVSPDNFLKVGKTESPKPIAQS
jgi:DNA-damage-inducible protein D